MKRNIDNILRYIRLAVDEHRLESGKYARWCYQSAKGDRDLSRLEYGCADAANILYTLGAFPQDADERASFVQVLQSFQGEDGLFEEPTHHPLHTTAHCVAALELFDAKPLRPLTYHKEHFDTEEKLCAYLASLDWKSGPWNAAHRGAGLYSAMVLTEKMPLTWQNTYFDWLSEHCDPETGLGLRGSHGEKPMLHHLAGWFHYLFNFTYARRPIPYAKQAVDACISLYREELCHLGHFGHSISFAEIDWVYILNRASSQCGHRREEAKETLRAFADVFFTYLETDLETAYAKRFDDMHGTFGALCAIAELQAALPGEILSTVPLRLVLDRRPFI
ncbi:MAG: hypothetical protein J6W28_05125 [Clostridia bacterium]|nr:hypothetical protein [Clostridia bacterium]